MSYLEYTMNSLSNILYNCSQRPNEMNCNAALDSIKRMLEEYNQAGGNVRIEDFRDRNKY